MICYMSIEWTNAVSFGLLKGRMTDTVWAAIKEEYSRNPKSFHYDDGKAIYYENGELIYQNVLNLNGLYNNDGIYRVEY